MFLPKYEKWVQMLKMRLGHPVIKIYCTDEMIQTFIGLSFDDMLPYLLDKEMISGTAPIVDLKAHKVIDVTNVYAAKADGLTMGGQNKMTGGGLFDMWAIPLNYSNMNNFSNVAGLFGVMGQTTTEMAWLNPRGWRYYDGQLSVSGYTGRITVECITERSLELMGPEFQDWCFEYSLAQLKEAEGEIRSKFQIDGSPFRVDGGALKSEGASERARLKEQLGRKFGDIYVTREAP